jgi:hypothetical protein
MHALHKRSSCAHCVRMQPMEATGNPRALLLLYSGGSGEKYQVSMMKRPSSIASTFFTLVNSSCCRSSFASNSPWCSSSPSSAARRFFDLPHAEACAPKGHCQWHKEFEAG